ncbi:MAG: glycosyltransferase family 2 protein [Nitrosarchaeum sp.]|nr:glycosyltransferase family 2 protein [Nitrosarchaeum sp.]
MERISVVIAAYNEARMIGKVVSGLKREGYESVIVVDDCSKDATAQRARAAGALVLRHPINRGQGAALKTGMDYALANGASHIVHFDADGQHRPEEIASLIRALNEGHDIAIGSRFLGKEAKNLPRLRKIALQGSVRILRFFYGLPVTDAHNGLRAMTASAATRINITQDRMAHASEIIEIIAREGLLWKEVPVHIDYTNYSLRKGASNLRGWLRILARMLFKKLL